MELTTRLERMYLIEDFKKNNSLERIVITQHSHKRFEERGISINDVCLAIESGEIIEQYPDDHPFPSCLILGKTKDKVIHIVASIDEEMIYIITAYYPDSERWEPDWKSRKEGLK